MQLVDPVFFSIGIIFCNMSKIINNQVYISRRGTEEAVKLLCGQLGKQREPAKW